MSTAFINKIIKKMKKIIFLLSIVLSSLIVGIAFANPTYYSNISRTATATTTVSYMTPGVGTTSLVYDTYDPSIGTNRAADDLALLIQFTASSTSSILNINLEYSNDGVDYYQNRMGDKATTTARAALSPIDSFEWKFSSSTPGLGGVPSNNNRDNRIVSVHSPTRFVRVIFSTPIGAANGGVWAAFQAKREKPE